MLDAVGRGVEATVSGAMLTREMFFDLFHTGSPLECY